jgi:hypothetical protein
MTEASDSEDELALAPPVEVPGVEANVWRLGKDGVTITSVIERHVDFFVDHDPQSIFFYAELGSPTTLKNDEETVQKVFRALAGVGLSEAQIVNAVNQMQNSGILFRERAV